MNKQKAIKGIWIRVFALSAILFNPSYAQSLQEVSVKVVFESEFVDRGEQTADEVIQSSINMTFDKAYLGIFGSEPVDDSELFKMEARIYGGWVIPFGPVFFADLGLTVNYYPDTLTSDEITPEIAFGLVAEIPHQPSVYFYYDIDLKSFTGEFTTVFEYELDQYMADALIELTLRSGYTDFGSGVSGFYAHAKLDLKHAISDAASYSLGIRAATGDSSINHGRSGNLWWGCTFSSRF